MIRWFVHHGTTTILGMMAMFAFGLWSYLSLPRESAPDIEIPVIIVSTPYIGVSPADVEALVTIPLENELASVTDVKKMSSSSVEGASIIAIEFEPEVNIDEALQKVRDRVSKAQSKLPEDAEDSSVAEVSFSDIPILLVTLKGGGDEQQLKRIAESLEEEVTRISGVLEADVSGGREREIHVLVDPYRLGHYGLSLGDVVGAVAAENVNIPGGDVVVGRASILLRTPGELVDPREIEQIAIKRVGDRPVIVSDVARVEDGFEERATYSRMDGEPSVTLSVKKRTGANLLAVAESVRALVAERATGWPPGVTYAVLGDQSEDIESMVSELENNMITALILVVGVILVTMGARSAAFVALSIPLSMFASFLVIDVLDYTLNMVVLFSLILALGMLVDNAIVVVENIYRHLEMGKDPFTASIDGAEEVAVAVASSTATTVAAFFPMIFWTGIMGQFMGYLPKMVIIVLTASLAAAVLILPVLTARVLKQPKASGEIENDLVPVDVAGLSSWMRGYHRVLQVAIDRRYTALAAGFGMLFATFAAYGVLGHGVEFFPATQPARATVAVRLPEGSDLEATDQVTRVVEGVLAQTPNIDTYVSEVGVSGSGNPLSGAQGAVNEARVTVDFPPAADRAQPGDPEREENTFITLARMRAAFAMIPGAEVDANPVSDGPPVGAPIAVEVAGDDFHAVGAAAEALLREIEKIEGTTDLKTDYRVGRPELRLQVDRAAAKRVGVSTQAIGGAVRNAIAGTKATAFRDGEDEYDVIVQLAPEHRDDLQKILQLRVPGREDTSPNTFPVPISAVASYELAGGAGTIKHVDQELVVTISGDVVDKSREAEIREDVAEFLEGWQAPPGVHASLGGAADEQAEAAAFLTWAFLVALALVMLVLVGQFDSITVPAIIMISVVLSLIGVLWGLILTGTAFGIIMTGIGVISLAGVVVNNAIVLLDYVVQLESRGMGSRDALLRAGVTRFRPVMLTAITTVLGLVPMALGISFDFFKFQLMTGVSSAQFWGPMAVAVSFGLTFATILTLVMVPTMYAILVDLRGVWARFRGGQTAAVVAKLLLGALALGALVPGAARAVTLDEAFAAAEDTSFEMRLVREQTAQARTLKWQAISAVMPRVILDASYVINQQEFAFDTASSFGPLLEQFQGLFPGFEIPESEPIVIQPKNAFSGNLTLYQPILNGQAFPAWQGAKRVYQAALDTEARTRQQVRGAVARVYYGLSSARKAVEVSEAAVALARQQVELARRQVEAGSADALVRMQAELAVSRAERDLLGTRAQLVEVQTAFTRLTGLSATTTLDAPPPVEVPSDLDAAVLEAVASRPDVSAAEQRVLAAQHERTGRDLEWMPSLDFTFTEIYNQVPGFIPENFQWRASFNLKWTIFDGGLRIARSRELASRTRTARILVEQAQENIRTEVAVGWERFQRAEQALVAVKAEVALAEEALIRAEARFGAGRASWLDVESARMSVEASRLALVTEQAARDLAAIDLLVATGTYNG